VTGSLAKYVSIYYINVTNLLDLLSYLGITIPYFQIYLVSRESTAYAGVHCGIQQVRYRKEGSYRRRPYIRQRMPSLSYGLSPCSTPKGSPFTGLRFLACPRLAVSCVMMQSPRSIEHFLSMPHTMFVWLPHREHCGYCGQQSLVPLPRHYTWTKSLIAWTQTHGRPACWI
jgi:hypothetical protein